MALGVTVGDLVEETRVHLGGTSRPALNRTSGSTAIDATTITFEFDIADTIQQGAYLGINDEVVYVWSTSGSTATVQRAQLGTDAAVHASGSIVEVDARFFRGHIVVALKNEIRSWPRSVFKVNTTTVEFGPSDDAVDLGLVSTTVLRALAFELEPGTTTEGWRPVIGASLSHHQDTTLFPSGYAVLLQSPLGLTRTMRVHYATPFNVSTFSSATDLETVGLSESMIDIPPLGAAARLLGPREASRTSTQPYADRDEAEAVPAGYTLRTAEYFRGLRNQRLAEEAARLLGEYPYTGF